MGNDFHNPIPKCFLDFHFLQHWIILLASAQAKLQASDMLIFLFGLAIIWVLFFKHCLYWLLAGNYNSDGPHVFHLLATYI